MNLTSLSPILLLLVYCVLVFLVSLAGGWLILALRLNHTRLQIAVSMVSGLMLGIGLLQFIPHAFHQNQSVDRTMQWALGGFLLMFFLQRLFHYHHHHEAETEPSSHETAGGGGKARESTPGESTSHELTWVGTTIGLALHSLVDGVALASSAFVGARHGSMAAGLGVALAVILHKPFGAMAISTLMSADGCSRSLRQLVNLIFALVTPVGALLFFLGVDHFAGANAMLQGNALAFCAGTFLCIACADLLPELQFHSHDRFKLSLALLVGLALAYLLGRFGHGDADLHSHQPSPESSITAPAETDHAH